MESEAIQYSALTTLLSVVLGARVFFCIYDYRNTDYTDYTLLIWLNA